MVSAEGELIPLKTRIKPSAVGGAVEKWLIQVLMLAFRLLVPACMSSTELLFFRTSLNIHHDADILQCRKLTAFVAM